MSAQWPSAVSTAANLYTTVNLLTTTLSGGINSAVTSIALTSTTGFQTAGAVTIDNEVIFYTNISGSSLTGCTRGADGTTAASHSTGVPVGATVVAYHVNAANAEIIAIEQNLSTRIGLGATQVQVLDGSAAAPSLAFATDLNTGFYSSGADAIGTATNGVIRTNLTTTELRSVVNIVAAGAANNLGSASDSWAKVFHGAGSAAAPSVTFASGIDGMYTIGSGSVCIATNGVERLQISTAAFYPTLPIATLYDGTASVPAYNFGNDSGVNMGMYRVAEDVLGFAIAGTRYLVVATAGVQVDAGQFFVPNGSASAPSYSFTSDTNTGFYWMSADKVGFVTGGSQRFSMSTTDFSMDSLPLDMVGNSIKRIGRGTVGAPGMYFNDNPTSGFYWPQADEIGISNAGVVSLRTDATNQVFIGNTKLMIGGNQSYPILQVVTATTTTTTSTGSTSFTDTSLTLSITPKFSTSKILVMVSGTLGISNTQSSVATIVRGSTNLFSSTKGGSWNFASVAGGSDDPCSMTVYDSPATTSATTYKVQIKVNTGVATATWLNTNSTGVITAIEIAQ